MITFVFFTFHCCTWLQFLIERLMHGTHREIETDSELWGDRHENWSSLYAVELYIRSLYRTFHLVGQFATEIRGKDQINSGTNLLITFFCLVGYIIRLYIVAQAYMLVQIIHSTSMKVNRRN